jgi:hypothetical protein
MAYVKRLLCVSERGTCVRENTLKDLGQIGQGTMNHRNCV